LRGARASHFKASLDKKAELTREAVMLRPMTPAESLRLVSELTEFAITISEAAESYAKEEDC
jgi:hypothetical protein